MAPANSFTTLDHQEIPRKFAEAATRALGRYIDPWFNPKYISPAIQQAPKSPAINSVGPAIEQNKDMATAKENLLREKLYTTFQGGQLRFLPMDDGVTDETPEMRSEYLKMFLKEPSIKSAMLSKIISVISSKMSVEPASEDQMDKETAKWITNILTTQRGGLRKMGENILLFSCVSGHALNEKVFHVEKKKQFLHLFPHGYIGLKQLKIKKPEDYRLEVDQFRNIRGVWSNRSSRRFDPSYFVITSFMPMYENPAGTSDLRSAIRAYNLILMAQQLRSIWTEQFSMPYMEGQYDKDDPDAKAFVEQAIQHLRALGWYVAPTGTTIRAIEASTKGETEFQAQIDDLRKEIYLSIVGSYLQAIEGDTEGGAGDSSVHRTTFELFQWYLCEVLAENINDQIIPDLMGMNFSGLENPRVSFAGVNAGDLLQSIAIRQAIKVLGIDQSKKAIRKEFEIDPPLDDTEDKLPGDASQQPGAGMPGMGLGLDGLNSQQAAPPPDTGKKPEGEAPAPLQALKLSEKPPAEGQYANGSLVLWKAMKFFDRGILSEVALSKEMRTGPDGFTDYGTMMRTARYHGVFYRDIEDPAIFDMEKEINHPNRLILTTMDSQEEGPTSFCLITRCDLKNDAISIINHDGTEEILTPEDFLDRWPGQGAKRRAVVLSTEETVETPEPVKHSESNDEDDEHGGGSVPGSGVGPRNPVHEKDIPAGPDGRDTYKLLNLAVEDGRDIVVDMAKKAATRMLKSGNTDEFFNESEVQALADSLEDCLAPADLLGRASVLLRLEKAKQMGDKVERFSEQPIGLAETFAERRLRPMRPSRALEYFKSLVPSMNLKEEKWLDDLKRKTFTMAEATNKAILERVHKAITKRMERGDNVSGAQAIEDILARAGIHPRNPQYCFLPGTLVEGDVVAMSKANYDGPAVEIQTDDGRRLRVSINHPVLTVSGWKAAGDIHEGENLVCYGDPVESLADQTSESILTSSKRRAVDNQKVPSRVEDVFQTLLEECSPLYHTQRPVSPLDFHGDAAFMDGKINRIGANWMLEGVIDSNGIEFSGKIGLVNRRDVPPVLPSHGGGLLNFAGHASPDTNLTLLESPCAPVPSSIAGQIPFRLMRLGTVPNLDASIFKAVEKTTGGDAKLVGDLTVAFPGLVSIRSVSKVERFRWTGHVYDLQTRHGFIVSQGILTSNCEMVWRTNFMDIHNIAAEEQRTDPDVVDDFPVWRYMGIKDGRQSEEHGAHFGKYYPSNVSFQKIRGERKWNCRCQGVPVYKTEWAKLKARGAKIAKFSEGIVVNTPKVRYYSMAKLEPVYVDDDGKVKSFAETYPVTVNNKNTQQLDAPDQSYEEHTPSQMSEKLKGGLGDNKPDSDFDPAALAKGMKVEMEHTREPDAAKEIAKDHLTEDPDYYEKLEKVEKNSEQQHDYCSTQFELPHAVGLKVLSMGERIKDEDLHEKGREDDPHITVLYGIHNPDAVGDIGNILREQKHIPATLRRTSFFSPEGKDYDVVKLNVDSPELHRLREKLVEACDNTQQHPYYQPHVTIGYVKKGAGAKYANLLDLEGEKIDLTNFLFCGQDEGKTQFKIGGANKFAEIYHGPKPPSDKGWQQMQPGPRGGKRWRKVH